MLPKKWMTSFLAFGNKKFEEFFMTKKGRITLGQQTDYYLEHLKRCDLEDFKAELSQLSPSILIEKIIRYENNTRQLQDLIRKYERKIKYFNKIRGNNKALKTTDNNEMPKDMTFEKVILGKKFDEAFPKY